MNIIRTFSEWSETENSFMAVKFHKIVFRKSNVFNRIHLNRISSATLSLRLYTFWHFFRIFLIKCYTVNNHLIFTKFSQQVVRAFYGKKRTNLSSVLHFLQIFLQTNTKIREKKIENIVRPVKKKFSFFFLIVLNGLRYQKNSKTPKLRRTLLTLLTMLKKQRKNFENMHC